MVSDEVRGEGVKRKYRPGPGWKHLGGAVWEDRRGVRIHIMGMIRLPDKTLVGFTSTDLWTAMKITGGNRKRALMIMARRVDIV